MAKTIFVRYYNPNEVMDVTPSTQDEEIKEWCFRVNRYDNEASALWAYANTPGCEWSTLLDENADVQGFINEAYRSIKSKNYDWLERNFT